MWYEIIESRREKWGVRGLYPIRFTGKSLKARDQEFLAMSSGGSLRF